MKIVSFLVIFAGSSLLLGNVPTTTRQFSARFLKEVTALYPPMKQKMTHAQISELLKPFDGSVGSTAHIAQRLGVLEDDVETIFNINILDSKLREVMQEQEITEAYREKEVVNKYKKLLANHGSLFDPQTSQRLNSFLLVVDPSNIITYVQKLYAAALENDHDMVATIRNDRHMWHGGFVNIWHSALVMAIEEDEPNWEAVKFLVDLDPYRGLRFIDNAIDKEVGKGRKDRIEALIKISGDPTRALLHTAQYGNKPHLHGYGKIIASHIIELGADPHIAIIHLYDQYSYSVASSTREMREKQNEMQANELKFLIEIGADANVALLYYTLDYRHDYNIEQKSIGIRLISELGADPLLVSEFVEQDTDGYEYFLSRTDYVRSNIDSQENITVIDYRYAKLRRTEQFIKELEYLTPTQARLALQEDSVNENLALLYLARRKDKVMAKYLIDRLGVSYATVAAVTQAGGDEEVATFLRELAE